MTTKNDKTLSESLFAFNNHIVSIKDVFKKAKTIQTSKLVRKIKLIKNKKGNEAQLEKNKRKCEHLKEEINQFKKLKFNDIAIFAFDNDGLSFEQYIKNNNKSLNNEKIALARVSLSKQVLQAIEKIKNDPKIDGWKRTFIQYKARCEKRKNWKEKNRLLKEIESKLKDENENEEQMDVDEKKEQEQIEKPNIKKLDDEKKATKKTKDTKKESKKTVQRPVKFSDDESENSELGDEEIGLDADDLDGYDSHEDDKWNAEENQNEEIKDQDDSEEEEENEEDEDEESSNESDSSDESQVNDFSKSNLENKEGNINQEKPALKPLIIGNKPSHMEIKQINLDEIQDCSEIPIENKKTRSDGDDTDSETCADTIKAIEDPFFLDKDGNEIQGEVHNFRPFKRDHDFDDELKSYSSYDNYRKNKEDFRNRRDHLTRSSFKTSLSSNFNREDNRFQRRNDYKDNNYRRNDRDKEFNSFDRNNQKFSRDGQRDFKTSYNKNFDSFNKFNNRTFNNNRQDTKPKEDLSKLHPSWQAKKLLEEKAKAKFEGKKLNLTMMNES